MPTYVRPLSTPVISPPASFAALAFGQSRLARWLAATLRLIGRLSPDLAARLAVDLFFAPFPTKLGSRKRPPPVWQVEPVEVDGVRVVLMRHREARSADAMFSRPRVLLVHGWAGDALQMRPLGDALAAAGFEPVLLDLPAHGRSDGWRCTMPQIVASLFAAQQHCGPFAAVVAHSMGAVASLHAVAKGLTASRLVVMAPSAPPASVLQWFVEVFRLGDRLHARMRERIETCERMPLAQFEVGWLGRHVRVPVLVIHDQGDRMAPFANGEKLAAALSGAQLAATHGLSHRRMLADDNVLRLTLAHLTTGCA